MNPVLNIFQSDWKITHRMPVEKEERGSPVVTWRENRDCPTVEASRGSICSEKFLSQITSTLFALWLVKGDYLDPSPGSPSASLVTSGRMLSFSNNQFHQLLKMVIVT